MAGSASETEGIGENDSTDKEKHNLSVMRSQGVNRRMKAFQKYCENTGYMCFLLLKPTWPRGKPRAMVTANFTGQLLTPRNGREGTGIKELKPLEILDSGNDDGSETGESDHGQGDVRGSPRSARPIGKAQKKKGKRSNKEENIRCHACGEVYDQERSKEENILWLFCGGEGAKGKGCDAFAAHATCWNITGGKKEVKKMCRNYIRCKACQEREIESSDEETPAREKQKRKKSSTTSSQPGPSSASNHHNEDEENSPSGDQHSSEGKRRKSAATSSKPGTSTARRGLNKSSSQSGSRTANPRHPSSDDDFQT